MIDRSRLAVSKYPTAYYRNALFMSVAGLAFLLFGFEMMRRGAADGITFGIMLLGGLFLALSISYLVTGRQYSRQSNEPDK